MNTFEVPMVVHLMVQRVYGGVVWMSITGGGRPVSVALKPQEAMRLSDALAEFPWDETLVRVGDGVSVRPHGGDMLLSVRGAEVLLGDDLADKVASAVCPYTDPDGPGASRNLAPAGKRYAGRAAAKKKVARKAKGARR